MRSRLSGAIVLGMTCASVVVAGTGRAAAAADEFVVSCRAFYVADAKGRRLPPEAEFVRACTCIKDGLSLKEREIVLQEIHRILDDLKAGRRPAYAAADKQPVLDKFTNTGSKCGRS